MAYRKVHINLSVDDEKYQQYRLSLRGTRFDRNGEVNASAALSYHMECVVEEQRKNAMLEEQIKNGVAPEKITLTSEILQTNDEYITNHLNKLLETKQSDVDEVIARKEPERQEKIYNYFAPICSNIVDRVVVKEEVVEPEFKPRVATEQEVRLLKRFEKEPEHVVITAVKRLRQEVREGKVIMEVRA
jgi:hypothetical protein